MKSVNLRSISNQYLPVVIIESIDQELLQLRVNLNGSTHIIAENNGYTYQRDNLEDILNDLSSCNIGDVFVYHRNLTNTPAIPASYVATNFENGVIHIYKKTKPSLHLVN